MALLPRAARVLAQALQTTKQQPAQAAARRFAGEEARRRREDVFWCLLCVAAPPAHTRSRHALPGGHAHDPANSVTYAGLTLSKPPAWEYAVGKVIGGTMWCVSLLQRVREGNSFSYARGASLFGTRCRVRARPAKRAASPPPRAASPSHSPPTALCDTPKRAQVLDLLQALQRVGPQNGVCVCVVCACARMCCVARRRRRFRSLTPNTPLHPIEHNTARPRGRV
jgi:hypothetical protein